SREAPGAYAHQDQARPMRTQTVTAAEPADRFRQSLITQRVVNVSPPRCERRLGVVAAFAHRKRPCCDCPVRIAVVWVSVTGVIGRRRWVKAGRESGDPWCFGRLQMTRAAISLAVAWTMGPSRLTSSVMVAGDQGIATLMAAATS